MPVIEKKKIGQHTSFTFMVHYQYKTEHQENKRRISQISTYLWIGEHSQCQLCGE